MKLGLFALAVAMALLSQAVLSMQHDVARLQDQVDSQAIQLSIMQSHACSGFAFAEVLMAVEPPIVVICESSKDVAPPPEFRAWACGLQHERLHSTYCP